MTTNCRHCGEPLHHEVIDLGHHPPSNAYLTSEQLSLPEKTYPLKVFLCTNCWLMQLPLHASADELFTADYAYFSSTSKSWCNHAQLFADKAIDRLDLGSKSFVVELASNDGYLLQYFKERSIPCLGIEPTESTADAARKKGIETIVEFFGNKMAEQIPKADLVVANNVLAHVPDINDFVQGISKILKPNGLASVEFPHLANLIRKNQFDTIYHEHYSYLSLHVVQRICSKFSLQVIDVETLDTHGGSLRVWIAHANKIKPQSNVQIILNLENRLGLQSIEAYVELKNRAESTKINLLSFLINSKQKGESVLAYGAAAKGNTLLNYCGIQKDLIPMVADRAKSKQGKFMPGSHIPIVSAQELRENKPKHIIILPWNLTEEVTKELGDFNYLIAIPHLKFWKG